MKSNKLDIKLRIGHPHFLEQAISNHNKFEKTDFEIIETVPDEVPLCRLTANNYTEKDLFSIGYKLAFLESKFKEENNRK